MCLRGNLIRFEILHSLRCLDLFVVSPLWEYIDIQCSSHIQGKGYRKKSGSTATYAWQIISLNAIWIANSEHIPSVSEAWLWGQFTSKSKQSRLSFSVGILASWLVIIFCIKNHFTACYSVVNSTIFFRPDIYLGMMNDNQKENVNSRTR